MIATTIEQSQHMLELGLDPETADMVWMSDKWLYSIKDNILDKEDFREIDTLAWSLTALLELMPQENEPELVKSVASGQYFVHGYFDLEKPTYMTKDYASPVDAAYEMVCWLLEQGLIKKGGN